MGRFTERIYRIPLFFTLLVPCFECFAFLDDDDTSYNMEFVGMLGKRAW